MSNWLPPFPDTGVAPDTVQPPQGPIAHLAPPEFEFQAVIGRAESNLLQLASWPKLVTLSAAPGYGKTVLMTRLHAALQQRGLRCLWVTLDDRDVHVSSVVFAVRAALARARQAAPDQGSVLFRSPTVDQLSSELAQLDGTTVLFIDNLGYCVDPELPAFLERLVFSSPPGLRLVMSSTRELPLDIVRAKLELGAVELGAPQLALDRSGIGKLIRDAGVEQPSDALLDRIQRQTEGWPTGVRLLQLLLLQQRETGVDSADAVDEAVEQFSGDQRDIARWLTRRVLTGFDPALVRFMAEIALVREFNAELAGYMTGCHEAAQWLRQLVSRNVLIFPLDRSHRWLRFHTLMREFLLAESRELLSPQRRSEVLERASRWHAAQGDPITALDIALDAQAVPFAQELLTRVASMVAGDQGRMSLYIEWVDRLKAQGGVISLEAQGWYVWALSHTMQYERARRALAEVDRQLLDMGPDAPAAEVAALRSQLPFLHAVVNVYLDRLPEARAEAVKQLHGSGPRDALFHGVALAFAAIGDIYEGSLRQARLRMDDADLALARTHSDWTRAWAAIVRAFIDMAEAWPTRAADNLLAVRETTARALGEDAQVIATMDFVRARALQDLGRTEQARETLRRALAAPFHHGISSSAEATVSVCAALWSGEEGDEFSSSVIDRLANCYSQRIRTAAAAGRMRRLLQLGRLHEARGLAQRFDLVTPHAQAYGDVLLAPLELQCASGSVDQTLLLIERHLASVQAQGRHRDRIELLLLMGELAQRRQQAQRAANLLALAITAAAPGRLVAPFLIRQAFVTQMLQTHPVKDLGLVQPIELAFLDRLTVLGAGVVDVVAPAPVEPVPGVTETLSAREIELLTLLDQGLANQQLADRLGLSVATVKWHLRNLYGKLGVGSRSAALAKARAANLLPR